MNHTLTTPLTPYQAAQVVNTLLTHPQVGIKPIPPQMMYNYTTARIRKGKAPLIPTTPEGKILPQHLQEWVVKYLTKKGFAHLFTTPEEVPLPELES